MSSKSSLATFSIVSQANSTGVSSWIDLQKMIHANLYEFDYVMLIIAGNTQRTCQRSQTNAGYLVGDLMYQEWCVLSTTD